MGNVLNKDAKKGMMKTSVKMDVDSVDSVDGRRPRSTVNQCRQR